MLMATQAVELTAQEMYTKLMRARRGQPVEATLARILSSWSLGLSAMPDFIGLTETDFHAMMAYCFPDFDSEEIIRHNEPVDALRFDEMEDLRQLLKNNTSGHSLTELWMVDIVIAGSLGSDHLWQDLGLWSRADLSKLMLDNFAPLAKRNVKNMKWKKFLYKQLCETEGIYTCRAPSCEVCADYNNCFGPED